MLGKHRSDYLISPNQPDRNPVPSQCVRKDFGKRGSKKKIIWGKSERRWLVITIRRFGATYKRDVVQEYFPACRPSNDSGTENHVENNKRIREAFI